MVKGRDGGNSGLALFAAELHAARSRAGLSRDELAGRINYSASLIGMIESLRRVPRLDFAERCDEVFATVGTFARLQQHARLGDDNLACPVDVETDHRPAGKLRNRVHAGAFDAAFGDHPDRRIEDFLMRFGAACSWH